MPRWCIDSRLLRVAALAASLAFMSARAQTIHDSLPAASTSTWTLSPEPSLPLPPSVSGQTKLYPDTSLTACPAGETLRYFFYYQDIPDFRGSTWCGAADASNDWANRTDPLRWRVPYLLESCNPGVGWYYLHALENGSRWYSAPVRRIHLLCEVSSCPVPPLSPVTDPVALEHEIGKYGTEPDVENLNERVRNGLACIVQRANALGANARASSGFRPPAYQAHLRELWDKWQLLKNNNEERCRLTKQQMQAEWIRHELVRRPVLSSNHSTGNAVDIKRVPPQPGT